MIKLSSSSVVYTFGIIIIIMLFFGYMVGGPFFQFLMFSLVIVFIYGLYRLAKSTKGSALLNFFGVLYMFVGSLSLILHFVGNPTLDIWMEDMPLVTMSMFLMVMGVMLKFFQQRAVLTITMFAHGGLTIYLLTFSPEVSVQMFAVGMIGLIVDALLLIYVNIMRGMVKEIELL